ncbi:MAG TPA: methylmalonyl-CoA mutase family protein, partial [Acidimicrobiales bacterium]|nr:methylmalonyl-CoA mutase family protein [Acidimicrobiales bacterium]
MVNNSQSEKEAINMSEIFNVHSRQDWEDLALETLSGKSIESLHEITDDEIEIKAIYSSEDQNFTNPAGVPGVTPFTRGIKGSGYENGTWDIRALIDESSTELANEAVLNELLNGSTSLFIDFEKIGINSITDLDKTLEDVFLNMTSIWLKPGLKGSEIAKWMIELWDQRGIENS